MSIHIKGNCEIAPTVLLPGDPLRAKWIAETFLRNVEQFNNTRNMFGYTGMIKEKKISVMGTGMGMPSLSIYVNELIDSYNAKKLIRVGTCGALQADMNTKDIVLVMGSCSTSNSNRRRFKGLDFAPIADWSLLRRAHEIAMELAIPVRVGSNLSEDLFYNGEIDPDEWKMWAKYGVLSVEMESAELYTLAARKRVQALSILTVSDVLPTGEQLPPEEREQGLVPMMEIALGL